MPTYKKEKPQAKASSRNLTGQESSKNRKTENAPKPVVKKKSAACSIADRCGGCIYLDTPYAEQLKLKQEYLEKLLKPFVKPEPIIGMKEPNHYRNKVNAAVGHDKNGNIITGLYEAKSHRILQTEGCLLEDEKASKIILSIRDLLKSFKVRAYSETSGYGLIKHIQVRTGRLSGEVMVVLVCVSPIFPSKNNFVKALLKLHPEITTIILNVNDKDTTMVLGERNITLYGPGFIKDTLCGVEFKISPGSFYQVNPVQTEILYNKAMEYAELQPGQLVFDAYCGIGTIGLVAAKKAVEVVGVELNRNAVKDAITNAKANKLTNASFYAGDAGEFLTRYAKEGRKIDLLFMDPPRSGSSPEFINACCKIAPERIVYISCGPDTLARDLELFVKHGYRVKKAVGVDMFAQTSHTEVVTCLVRG